MTIRMLYAPPPLFGMSIFKVAPVEVEVLETAGTVGQGMARIRIVVPADALINLLAGVERKPRVVERLVFSADLKPL